MELKNHNQSSHLTSYSAARSSLCFQRQVLSSVGRKNLNRDRDRYRNRKFIALGHEKLDDYRLAAMMSRLGKRGYSVQEEPSSYGIDPDFDFDEIKSQPGAALNAVEQRE